MRRLLWAVVVMRSVIEQIQRARDVHTDSVAIGLDVLLRAHLSGDSEACTEMLEAWDRVLKMPEYEQKYHYELDKGRVTILFVGLVAVVGAVAWKLWGGMSPAGAQPAPSAT